MARCTNSAAVVYLGDQKTHHALQQLLKPVSDPTKIPGFFEKAPDVSVHAALPVLSAQTTRCHPIPYSYITDCTVQAPPTTPDNLGIAEITCHRSDIAVIQKFALLQIQKRRGTVICA